MDGNEGQDRSEEQAGDGHDKDRPEKDRPELGRATEVPRAPHGAFGEGVDLDDVAEGVERRENPGRIRRRDERGD